MNDQGYDLAVIGAGPGGYVAAIQAAQQGLKTALIEQRELGGVCLQAGCIPTKALLASVDLLRQAKAAAKMGVKITDVSASWADISARRAKVVKQLTQGVQYLLEKNGVTIIRGRAVLKSATEIEIYDANNQPTGPALAPRRILLATGSKSTDLPCAPRDGVQILHSGDLLAAPELKGHWIIIGGGYIGCELAGILQPMGCQVTIVEALDHLLPNLELELGKALERVFTQAGIQCHFQAKVARVETQNGVQVILESGQTLTGNQVLVSVGRTPNLQNLGLEQAGIAFDRRGIVIDGQCHTSVPTIFAIGDVTGKLALAHVASAQARVAVKTIAAELKPGAKLPAPLNYAAIPACVFTHPEIATVGLTEAGAAQLGIATRTGRFPFAAAGKALAGGETDGFVKWVAEAGTGKLLGGHILGHNASELIATMGLAVQAGLTAEQVTEAVFAHPTLSEAMHEAAEGIFGKSTHFVTRR